jgi:hypothetical protein
VNRLAILKTGTARVAALAVAIRAAAGSNRRNIVNHVRIHADGSVDAYDWRPAPLYLSVDAQDAISDLMRSVRPDIDWSVGHDYHLTTGMLRRSPTDGERGYAPETDGTFGGTDPAFLPTPADLARIEAS